jgi:hypothetical protein
VRVTPICFKTRLGAVRGRKVGRCGSSGIGASRDLRVVAHKIYSSQREHPHNLLMTLSFPHLVLVSVVKLLMVEI